MVTFTAATQLSPSLTATATTGLLDVGKGPTQVVGGLQPAGVVGTATRPVGTQRTGFHADTVAPASALGVNLLGIGNDYTQVVNGLQPDAVAGLGTPTIGTERPGVHGDTVAAGSASTGLLDVGLSPTQVVNGLQPQRSNGLGALIPTAFFRQVTGSVLDENGNPIEGALYLAALGIFPTLGNVDPDTGAYNIYLLRQTYRDLVLLQKAPNGKPYDFVRYELAENPDLDIQVREADLYFDTTLPKPVQAGSGMKFGGMMQT